MGADLSDFTEEETDEQDEIGPNLQLYTAGSGNGDWAYVVEGADTEKRRRDSYSGDSKRGFITQLKAVAEGTAFLDDEYPDAEVTIFTPHEAIVGLVEGESNADRSYYDLYLAANANYNNNRGRWDIRHHPENKENPARDLI